MSTAGYPQRPDVPEHSIAREILQRPGPEERSGEIWLDEVTEVKDGVRTEVAVVLENVVPDLQDFEGFEMKREEGAKGRLDRFVLKKELGRGGQGVVYEAWDEGLERTVVLKLLHVNKAPQVNAFIKEMRTMARVADTGIARVHTAGKFKDFDGSTGVFYVMPRYEGSLGQEAEQIRSLPKGKLIAYLQEHFLPLVRSIQGMHDHHIIHRDIKPENILVDESGGLKLADFGITQELVEGAVQEEAIGTPKYMSPEMAIALESGATIGAGADWYSLAASWYHILTKEDVFSGQDKLKIIDKLLGYVKDPAFREYKKHDLKEVLQKKSTPRHFAECLLKLLDAEPGNRIPPEGVLAMFTEALQADAAEEREAERKKRTLKARAGVLIGQVVNAVKRKKNAQAAEEEGDRDTTAIKAEEPELTAELVEASKENSGKNDENEV